MGWVIMISLLEANALCTCDSKLLSSESEALPRLVVFPDPPSGKSLAAVGILSSLVGTCLNKLIVDRMKQVLLHVMGVEHVYHHFLTSSKQSHGHVGHIFYHIVRTQPPHRALMILTTDHNRI